MSISHKTETIILNSYFSQFKKTDSPTFTKIMNLYKVENMFNSLYKGGFSNWDSYVTNSKFKYSHVLGLKENGEFYSDMDIAEIKKKLDENFIYPYVLKKQKNVVKEVKFIGIKKEYYKDNYNKIKFYIYDEDRTYYYILDSHYKYVKKYKYNDW